MTKKQRFLIGAFYMLVPFVAHLLVVLIISFMSFDAANIHGVETFVSFYSENPFVNLITDILSFGPPTFFCVLYVLPIFFDKPSAKVHAANVPIVFALAGMTGWMLNFLSTVVVVFYIRISMGVQIYFLIPHTAIIYFLAAVLASSSSFLLLETANRTKILALYFPKGKIFGTEKLINPSIKFSFVMYYVGSAIFPIVMLLLTLYFEENANAIEINWAMIIIAVVFMCVGLTLTVLLVSLFTRPLKELNRVAQKISDGDFKDKVRVTSGDEIGRLGDTFNDMSKSLSEKEFMKDLFGKIVTPDVRDHLMHDGEAGSSLGGEDMNVTILFCDIRGFTSLSEKMESKKIVQMLNYYFTAMGECITHHHGIINKFIGDAVMALFGAPVKSSTHAMDAYLAALEMREALVKVNEEFARRGFPELKFGIGIHTGKVAAGNIGSNERMEYTVIGDGVNSSSRICSLCKDYKHDLLISEATYKRIISLHENYDNVHIPLPQFLCESAIRGKEEKIKLYTM